MRDWKRVLLRELPLPKNLAPVLASVTFAWVGHRCLDGYSLLHWRVAESERKLAETAITMQIQQLERTPTEDAAAVAEGEAQMEDIFEFRDEARRHRSAAMSVAGVYRLCGFLSVIFCIWGLRTGPPLFGLVSLPAGLYGVVLTLSSM